ncbi:hypothetical protein EVAR_16629_1 [Eumeta japonica]|uniref:Uncharacterized protein n=1 Tax=Eumeta variegata TaxID=151549 RepID=A0A4C1UZH0_EUMVA|nr:hypothetical protein EVAR_16629_1 [Eumeta japonica]
MVRRLTERSAVMEGARATESLTFRLVTDSLARAYANQKNEAQKRCIFFPTRTLEDVYETKSRYTLISGRRLRYLALRADGAVTCGRASDPIGTLVRSVPWGVLSRG